MMPSRFRSAAWSVSGLQGILQGIHHTPEYFLGTPYAPFISIILLHFESHIFKQSDIHCD